MFILTHTVNEHRFAVKYEPPVTVIALDRPAERAYAIRGAHLFGGLAVTLYHCGKLIKIRVTCIPKMSVSDRRGLGDKACLAWIQSQLLTETEHLPAIGIYKLIYKIECSRLVRIVLYFGLYKHRITLGIVPYVHAKRLHSHLVSNLKLYRTEYA